ncbi:MAG: hypothetical protein ACREIV_15460 [Planctomycetaceae bacterium]
MRENYIFGYGRDSAWSPAAEQEQECLQWFLAQSQSAQPEREFPEFAEYAGFYGDARDTLRTMLFARPAGGVLLERLRPGDLIVCARYDMAIPGRRACDDTARIVRERGAEIVILDWPEFPSAKGDRRVIVRERAGLDPQRVRRHASYGWKQRRSGRTRRTFRYRWVVDEHDRELARLVVRLRDEQGLSWRKIHAAIVLCDLRRSDGSLPCDKTLRNAYYAAKSGFPALRDTHPRTRVSGDRALRPPSLGLLRAPSGSSAPSPPAPDPPEAPA